MNKLQIKKTTWDLALLLPNADDESVKKERERVEKASNTFVKKWQSREDYLKDPKVLLTALDEYEALMREFGTSGREGYYFWLQLMLDQNNPDIKAKFNSVQEFSNQIQNTLQFFELRLAKIPKNQQKTFLSYKPLHKYLHFLEKIFKQADYLLSEPEEKIMNLKSDPAHGKWVQMISGFIAKEEQEVITDSGKKQKKNFEELASLSSSKKKQIRDSAAKGINTILAKYTDIAENELNAILANKKVDDTLRNMPRPDFSRHLGDDIDSEVVDTLIQTVSKRYDIAKRFYKLKAKLLKVKQLEYHERNVELGEADKEYSFDRGAQLVYDVFQNLDTEFADIFARFLKNGNIDVRPKKGKRGGAFCAYWLISQPTYVLLNYTDNLRDVTTIAHEMGHGINNELMKQKQHALNFGTPMATAEVASVFMEDFVLQEILKTANDQLKLDISIARLNDEIATVFRQVACYQFEQELHDTFRQSGYLSHTQIGKIFQKHMAEYMGPAVKQSAGSENWWIHWWHIRTFFYVYSYASGLLIGKSMQNSVKENHDFIEKVKEFLSSGLSASPKDIFKNMGIDITDATFWNRGIDEMEKSLEEVEKLAKKLGKI